MHHSASKCAPMHLEHSTKNERNVAHNFINASRKKINKYGKDKDTDNKQQRHIM
jgi:hypothetical protein